MKHDFFLDAINLLIYHGISANNKVKLKLTDSQYTLQLACSAKSEKHNNIHSRLHRKKNKHA